MTNKHQNKKRILIANDASFIASGYGVYGKEILTRLHNSGEYDVAELGCYTEVGSPAIKNIPWKFYPNAVSSKDPRFPAYKESATNQFGAWRFHKCLLHFRPHIVFDIRDYWMYAYQETTPLREYFHWILMPTVDSAPQKLDWLYTFCNADVVVPYTKWSQTILQNMCGNKINLFPKIANAGINETEFYPLENKDNYKKSVFGQDYNVIGLVMRNQKRKLIPDMLLVYKKYLELLKNNNDPKYQNTILYLHTSFPEENGWDLPSLLMEMNLVDKVYFTHSCRKCQHIYPAKFKGPITKCPACGEIASSMTGVSNSISTQELNKIYNLFDVFIQYAICEGFGMPQIEAAACGVPIASVDYSAMTEIVENLEGVKLPVQRMFRELETNADRAYPDIDATVEFLNNFFSQDASVRLAKGRRTRELCIKQYSWDSVYAVWKECFDSVDITTKRDWNNPVASPTDFSLTVPNNLSPYEFVEFICKEVIKDPVLFKSAYIQTMIKELTNILNAKNGSISTTSHQEIVDRLNNCLSNKITTEQIRINHSLPTEDFLQCQQNNL